MDQIPVTQKIGHSRLSE